MLGDVSPEMSCFQDEIFGPVCHMIILGLKAIDGTTRGRAHERRDCHSSSYKLAVCSSVACPGVASVLVAGYCIYTEHVSLALL